MNPLLLMLSAWLLVLVFALAGFSKLQDASATAQSLKDFGVPEAAARQAAQLLPWLELAIAGGLLLPYVAWFAALSASVLLALFTVVVVLALRRGERPSCNCFGQVRSRPISGATAVRNGLFTACAALLVLAGADALEPGLVGVSAAAMGAVQGSSVAITILVGVAALQFWLMLHLTRQHGRMLLKIDNLELKLQGLGVPTTGHFLSGQVPARGSPAPDFEGTALSGRPLSLSGLMTEHRPLLMLFVSADCAPCKELLLDLSVWLTASERQRVLVISSGSAEANRSKFSDQPQDLVLVQTALEINERYGVIATPSALRLDRDGRIDSDLAIGHDAIQQLLAAASAPRATPGLPALATGA